jgi:NAD(P)-dependent dehydrogenase (short-subunit alcohol dehydrogenase family)
MSLKGKIVFITGASGGIGAAGRQQQSRPFSREGKRSGRADAAAGPGDENDFSL